MITADGRLGKWPLTRDDLRRGLGVLASIAGIAGLHLVTSPLRLGLHEFYNYLCYVPIIAGAYWFGLWGGVLSAVLTSAAFIPHVRATWIDRAVTATQYGQVLAFHLIGLSVGWLAAAQRRLTVRYRDAAMSLERANRELSESVEHLRRADRLSALGEIAAGLAHEIQNPLAGIKGAFDIVASRVPVGSAEAEFVTIAGRELARLEELVGEFLTYARPQHPARRMTDPHALVQRVVALLRPQAERKQVRLVVESPSMTPALSLDPEQITQVIFNVILNAIQATTAGGRIRIRESFDADSSTVEIIDQGPGIPPEHASRIFDPFFTTKSQGTGLGLAICQRIMAAHGGTIDALPATPSGTVFRIRLPRTA